MASTDYIKITHRELPYTTFDADNHLYENRDALTKFLPREYEGVIKYVDINGRTKLAIRDKISDYIPNPTFGKVAVPGGAGYDVTKGGKGFGDGDRVREDGRDAEPRCVLRPGAAPRAHEGDGHRPHAAVADARQRRSRSAWPTTPTTVCIVIHALNEWMHEHWTYVYSDAIYSTPIISLAAGAERALEELEFVHERGAKIFLIRVAPVPTWKGRKSFALPEFDPFWARVQELDVVVGMHSGDSGYTRYTNEWEGLGDREMTITAGSRRSNPTFLALSSEKDNLVDAMASIIGHGLATRFPKLRFMPVEFGSGWIRPFYRKLQRVYDQAPVLFDENPVDVFNRSVWVHAFHEPDPKGLIDLGIPADHVMFGSDFPHPEGMEDPLAYSEVVKDLPMEDQALIMGGALERAMKVGAHA